MSILKKIFARRFCGSCEIAEKIHERLLSSNSKIVELNDSLETFNKLLLFNDTQENIIYVEPHKSLVFTVTIKQTLRYDVKIDKIDLHGYFLDKQIKHIKNEKPPVKMNCCAVYNDKGMYLKNIHIIDFTVEAQWQNQGYGSIVIEQLIKFAWYLNVPYISGDLSFMDIGVSDDDENKCKNRERLYHFYP